MAGSVMVYVNVNMLMLVIALVFLLFDGLAREVARHGHGHVKASPTTRHRIHGYMPHDLLVLICSEVALDAFAYFTSFILTR